MHISFFFFKKEKKRKEKDRMVEPPIAPKCLKVI
jgi:hypothetical protein